MTDGESTKPQGWHLQALVQIGANGGGWHYVNPDGLRAIKHDPAGGSRLVFSGEENYPILSSEEPDVIAMRFIDMAHNLAFGHGQPEPTAKQDNPLGDLFKETQGRHQAIVWEVTDDQPLTSSEIVFYRTCVSDGDDAARFVQDNTSATLIHMVRRLIATVRAMGGLTPPVEAEKGR